MRNEDDRASDADELVARIGTREAAVEFPFDMSVTAYLMMSHGIPKLWREDDLLYHYTDAAGLRGILEEQVFWATKSPFLNDPTEIVHAVDVVVRRLKTVADGAGRAAKLAAAVLPTVKVPETDVYVSSFCRDGDLLSQWRGYGAFGQGYALGFQFGYGPQQSPPAQIAWLVEIIYDEQPLIRAVDEILAIFVEFLETSERSSAWEIAVSGFPDCLRILWLSFKHASYREENEVRILAHRSSRPDRRPEDAERYGKVHYRTSKADLIPYVKVAMAFPDQPLPLLPLKRVVVGPGVNYSRNNASIQQMLADLGYDDVEVVASQVPFSP